MKSILLIAILFLGCTAASAGEGDVIGRVEDAGAALGAAAAQGAAAAEAPSDAAAVPNASAVSDEDPYLWMERIDGEKPLAWARERDEECKKALVDPEFERMQKRLLAIYQSKDRIPYVDKKGKCLYNFWRDDTHIRGLLRRTTMESYVTPDPKWETVLDLDQLAKQENENWVWSGYDMLWPDYDRALVFLSRGGADAQVTREFDLKAKAFIEDGFFLPEAKSMGSWKSLDTLLVATDFGPGTLNDSGYPRLVKEWVRGTPLSAATLVYEGQQTDVWAVANVIHDRGYTYEMLTRADTFFSNEKFLRRGGKWVKIDKPQDAEAATFADQLLLSLRTDFTAGGKTYKAGSLLAAPLDDYLNGGRNLTVLYEPTERSSLAGFSGTRHHLLLNELNNVRNRIAVVDYEKGTWKRQPLETPDLWSVDASGVDPDESDEYWLTADDFLTPSSLYLGTIGKGPATLLKKLPSFYDAAGLTIEQFEAVSRDGTHVPYFIVHRKDMKLDGTNPTLLYGYGGFEVVYQAHYSGTVGSTWLEKGGVYALAGVRGGGEFGPKWHEAALKAHRQKAFDDFIAVGEDLVSRKVTSPPKLGIMGGSNGGLLMGMMLVERPDLWGAIVCEVPLLDMKRYTKLGAGASWIAEYGDPDKPEDWAYLKNYSPYQLVQASVKYPPILFTTSTRDDRVHPAHARKMAAKMLAQGHDVLYYENIEGGHASAANDEQRAFMNELGYRFLQKKLGLE